MVASSLSTNQRSIFTHIVLEKSGHTYRQQINGQFHIVISLSVYGCIISVNESMVHFHTYSPGKKWSYASSTDQRSISCSFISQDMVASSVSTNQRSIFTYIVLENSAHTHRQQINSQFHVVISLRLGVHHQYQQINGPFLHI